MAPPTKTLSIVPCVFLRLALAGLLISCPVHAAIAETSPRSIIASWQAREATVKSARIEWIERRLDKKGSISGPNASPPYVNWRLKRYQLLALETVPVGENERRMTRVVLFDLSFFGCRPGWRFGTV
jgi:hypothetical protein